MQVLIVDDDVIALQMLRNVLEQARYEVHAASNGAEAMEILRQGSIRLVVSDWEMPVMSGVDLCRSVRSEGLPGYVYFVLLTSRDQTEDVVEGMMAGADDFIAKPFSAAELVVRVRAGERILAAESREIVIFAMAKLAESRDTETGAHLERVRNYSRLLAQQLSTHAKFKSIVDAEYVRLLYLTSPLHDVGKIGIPDSVLMNSDRLNQREWDVMKTHTTLGAQTLEAALAVFPEARFLRMARDIAMSHHERYDGTGYPQGLMGEQIPLSARIVSLADVYDALISRRRYKTALSHEVARSIVLEGTESHFDPDVVAAFVETEEQFIAVSERLRDTEAAAA